MYLKNSCFPAKMADTAVFPSNKYLVCYLAMKYVLKSFQYESSESIFTQVRNSIDQVLK